MRKKKKVGLPIRTLLAMLAVALLLGGAMGGTLAWLTAGTTAVTNTFSTSEITITLAEDTKKNDGSDTDYTYKMVPGNKIEKDPYVTVGEDSEPCWLFIAVKEENNLDNYITYEVRTGENEWSAYGTYTNIYYRKVTADEITAKTKFYILTGADGMNDGHVVVKDTVTSTMMETAKTSAPTLAFDAYAVQSANIADADAAWAQVSETFKALAKKTN